MQSDFSLSENQNLIITLLRKSKPDFQFDISLNETGIPELVMEYGVAPDIPNDSLLANIPYKYRIPLGDDATWTSVKKLVDFFEKHLKNMMVNNTMKFDLKK